MKITLPKNQVIFYLWVGLTYLLLWNLGNLINYPDTFWVRSINEIWRTAFITVVNFILFEYTLPYINLSWKKNTHRAGTYLGTFDGVLLWLTCLAIYWHTATYLYPAAHLRLYGKPGFFSNVIQCHFHSILWGYQAYL